MPLKTYPFDGSRYLDTWESQTSLLNDAIETGDPEVILSVFGMVARAHGMTAIAREAGVDRDALYEAMADDANPDISALRLIAKTLLGKHPAELTDGAEQSPPAAAE
jgi:probable addiction module antidote protein